MIGQFAAKQNIAPNGSDYGLCSVYSYSSKTKGFALLRPEARPLTTTGGFFLCQFRFHLPDFLMNGRLEVQRGVPVPSLVCEVAWVGESAGHFLLVGEGYFAFEEQHGSEFGTDNFCRSFFSLTFRQILRFRTLTL